MSPMHIAHPYPTEQEKAEIMADTGIEMKQLTNWFVNNRKRYWKPRVEAKLKQQAANRTSSSANKTQHVRAHQGRSGVVGALLSEETMEPLSPEPSSTPSKRSTVRRTNSVVSFDMLSTERQGSDNSSKFQSIVGSEYAPAVSEASSFASESASDSEGESSVAGDGRIDEPGYGSDLTTDDFGSREYVKRLELVDVYVFRPPAGTDAITLDNISTEYNGEEVLKTYYQREISYSFPERNPSKVSSNLVLRRSVRWQCKCPLMADGRTRHSRQMLLSLFLKTYLTMMSFHNVHRWNPKEMLRSTVSGRRS